MEGIGPKRALVLYDRLGVASLDHLGVALSEGKVAELPGFGPKTVERLERALAGARARRGRTPLVEAEALAAPLLSYLESCPESRRVEVAGSLRRRRESVGDVDILVVSTKGPEVMDHLRGYDAIQSVEGIGSTRASLVLNSGLEVDVRVVRPVSYGAALQYFTGSKAHSVALRKRAQRRHLKLNEYGVFAVGKGKKARDRRVAGPREEDVYGALGLPWIPPELREDRGELQAAAKGRLPDLMRLEDIKGDLQTHSTWSDGRAGIREMAEAAKALGYEYMAVTDHSRALAMTGGLTGADLERQGDELESVREAVKGIEVLAGIEVEVLKDGSLDMDDEHLASLDFVLAAVHTHMGQDRRRMTRRLVAAVSHPCVHALAHPSGRLIGERDPVAFDLDAVVEAAVGNGVALELNANPKRLDLDDSAVRRARELGAMITINTDAHDPAGFGHMRFGVDQARRGWLEAPDVINTLSLADLREWLSRDG